MELTDVNKILVENFGYEWINGKAWAPGTAPEFEVDETTNSDNTLNRSDIQIEVLSFSDQKILVSEL